MSLSLVPMLSMYLLHMMLLPPKHHRTCVLFYPSLCSCRSPLLSRHLLSITLTMVMATVLHPASWWASYLNIHIKIGRDVCFVFCWVETG